MNYIESIYICMVAPLIFAIIGAQAHRRRSLVFLICGMTSCLLSSYISTSVTALYGAGLMVATVEIAPMVEECMKLIPVLFYLMIFAPKKDFAADGILMTAIGFATFENVCYLTRNGAVNLTHLVLRGFGTGAMHVVCGMVISIGIFYLWDKLWLRVAGTVGLVFLAATMHSCYNMLISQTGAAVIIGYLIPIMITVLRLLAGRRLVLASKEDNDDEYGRKDQKDPSAS